MSGCGKCKWCDVSTVELRGEGHGFQRIAADRSGSDRVAIDRIATVPVPSSVVRPRPIPRRCARLRHWIAGRPGSDRDSSSDRRPET